MAVIDIVILGFLLIFAIRGMSRGLIIEMIGILGIILAFLCSFMVYQPMLNLAEALGLRGNVASVTAYVLGFIAVYIVVIILGNILHKALTVIRLGWLNRLFGFLFGGLKGVIIASLVLWAAVYAFPSNAQFVKDIKGSQVAAATMDVVPYIYDRIGGMAGAERVNPFK